VVSTPQNETNAPVDRRLKTASGGGGGLEAEGGIFRFRLWYMERFQEPIATAYSAKTGRKRDHSKSQRCAEKWFPGFRPRSATEKEGRREAASLLYGAKTSGCAHNVQTFNSF
jgi:hypothetical protein